MARIKVRLRPVADNINLPTVIKTAVLPGEVNESLFIATQPGEVLIAGNGTVRSFLDIRSRVLKLGSSGGYDERGLLGLAFHPEFTRNGLFYLHYSVAGSQGPGALRGDYLPDPCSPNTLTLRWTNRSYQYDHIDTIEEWVFQPNGQHQKRRTLLTTRRPFFNHNGVNSLNFSPETGKLVFTNGDGGKGYDPFNLSQNDMEIAGKIIEIDVDKNVLINNLPPVTRFSELPAPVRDTFTVIAKGIRNVTGISYQNVNNQYIKYVGNVGQDMVESIYSFAAYNPIPVNQFLQASAMRTEPDREGFINFGWRGWEGIMPTAVIRPCAVNPALNEKITAYYQEAVTTSAQRLEPLTCYFHEDPRPDKFAGSALTGVQAYMGNAIPALAGNVVFTDLALENGPQPARGTLAFTRGGTGCKPEDFFVIDTDFDFGAKSAYYVSLGTNSEQTRLYLGVYGTMRVIDPNQGSVFEIVP